MPAKNDFRGYTWPMIRLAACALLLALGLSGCDSCGGAESAPEPAPIAGGDARPASAGPDGRSQLGDACALLSTAELKSITGLAFKPGASTGPSSCRWAAAKGAGELTLRVYGAGLEQQWHDLAGDAGVPGLGEKAAWSEGSRRLVFVKGGRLVSLAAGREGVTRPQAVELARRVAARL